MAESEKQPEAMQEAPANPNASAPAKNAVAAEPSHLNTDYEDLGSPVVKPTDSNPDATKKVTKASDEVSKSAQVGQEPTHLAKAEEAENDSEDKEEMTEKAKTEKEVEEEEKEVKAKKDSEIDVKEDVEALVGNSDLSDEFKQKAATIFEAAIKSKVKAESERLEAEYDKKFEEEIEKSKSALTEKVDSYLSYVVEEWMKDNQLALERGIKGEIAEDFIAGLKKLFEDHYIDVPDEKYDVLEDQASKIEDLEKKLNEEIEKNVDMNKVNSGFKRQEIIDEHSSDLADTAKEKFDKLVEDVEYSSEEDFATKVKTIKESYFEQKSEGSPKEGDIDNVAEGGETSSEDLTNAMAAYTNAISQTKDKIKIV